MKETAYIDATLKSERELSNGEGVVQVYDVGKYNVIIRGPQASTGNHLWVEIRRREDIPKTQYLPYLIVNCFDDEGYARYKDVLLDTTSYGSLSVDEAAKFIDAMEEGLQTARFICKRFLQPMVDGTWSWKAAA